MRFLSRASAIASGGESGYNVWDQGCGNSCKATIMGKQFYEEQGRCYIKNKGIYLTIPCDHNKTYCIEHNIVCNRFHLKQ